MNMKDILILNVPIQISISAHDLVQKIRLYYPKYSERQLRDDVHKFRIEQKWLNFDGQNYYLVSGNFGYQFQPITSLRYRQFFKRIENSVNSLTQILNSI